MNFTAHYSHICKPTLVLMAGLPGAGKTTLAHALGKLLNWPVIDKDVLKSTLLTTGLAEKEAQIAAYNLLFAMADDLIVQQRLSAILDSPAQHSCILEKATEITHAAGVPIKVVLCLAHSSVRNQRLQQRTAKVSQLQTDALTTEEEDLQRYLHLPPGTLIVRTTQPVEGCVSKVLSFLESS